MKIFENKVISIILMVVLIASGLFIGGTKSLNGLYSDVEDVFYLGVDRDGIGVANDMTERVKAATNMVTIARKYEASANETYKEAIQWLTSDTKTLETVLGGKGDIGDAITANKNVDTAMTFLYNEMEQVGLSAQDEKYRQSLYADFNSRGDTISHDPYNQYAEAYMNALEG
ncbi:MAG: hypothetical protein IIX87_02110, partial [Firmicutes bacterium]|nr:hypothetical protein [Bacillota bacterium]